MTGAEKNYATIEKEALAITWASERFNDYIMGLSFVIETDHKPLIPLLNSKELAKMPPRIQRFRLRMMKYDSTVVHVPGKQQITADALSRAPVDAPIIKEDISKDANVFALQTVDILPASTEKLTEIRQLQVQDSELIQIRNYCQHGWPNYMPESVLLK